MPPKSSTKADPKASTAKTQVTKAKSAKKAVVKGTSSKTQRRVRTSATFHRPKTLRLSRKPKYPRTSVPHAPRMDAYRTLIRPLNTESAMKKIEDNNTLLFIVDLKANKRQIAAAVKKLYDVTPLRVNTLIRPDGIKKAFVRLTPDVDALDIANKGDRLVLPVHSDRGSASMHCNDDSYSYMSNQIYDPICLTVDPPLRSFQPTLLPQLGRISNSPRPCPIFETLNYLDALSKNDL
ncbi:hypothetical protein MJO28_000135 [Puccinia striiformis f. sp. tritici]|uniref:Large ribosomal subunit protein uL23 N-terminal domain-containing protein n=3 Tax=Puccinia striiformis TaxID=27350 RepID=A0A0L0VM28_9BASI|nr:hypothetical protein MJO28_000135 [Puccinia striiformis f. sp. tritici]KAI9631279.1 hypothetical protein KEM48_014521 [Puccinia striiformis f. sp. tritici PST-130]KNF00338.1 hypothetical protein PSTG_06511 [Puccinia striiformis f. sp. tritici PST-78]POW03107.1 hypothetical protein PSHT_11799 [Puccinia striiformis]